MNEELSIGTDIACEPDVALNAPTDTDGNVPVDIKHLSADPENVAQFREQLHSKPQSKATESTSTTEGATKRDASENPVSKRQLPNERNFFGNSDRHTPSFVSGKNTSFSQNQSTNGSRKDFYEKSMKFDISSQSAALKAYGGTPTNNVTHEKYALYKSPFFEKPDPSKISVNNTKDFRETFTNTETLSTDTSLRTLSGGNKTNFSESVSQSHPDLPQPSQTLKSPATLLRELQNPTASNAMPTLEETTDRVRTAPNTANIPANNVMREVPVFREPKHFVGVPTKHATASEGFTQGFQPSVKASSLNTSSAETLHTPQNHTALHSYDGNDAVSPNPSVTKPTETNTRKHPHSSENTSEPHRTAVIDTIPFLRAANETVTAVQGPTTTQTAKSHAMLIAQQIRDHIIDRILVSSSALNGNRTVTVQLSPQLLQDTEVQFTQNGTSLDIRLFSQNKDSVQFLQQHQSDLQTYLQGELKTYRAISVRVPSSQASGELAQPHDGRSRNRFDYQPTDEEETT